MNFKLFKPWQVFNFYIDIISLDLNRDKIVLPDLRNGLYVLYIHIISPDEF